MFRAIGGPSSSYTQYESLGHAFVSKPKHVPCIIDGGETDVVVLDVLCARGTLSMHAIALAAVPLVSPRVVVSPMSSPVPGA